MIELTDWVTDKKMNERFLQLVQYDNEDGLKYGGIVARGVLA